MMIIAYVLIGVLVVWFVEARYPIMKQIGTDDGDLWAMRFIWAWVLLAIFLLWVSTPQKG